MIKKTEIRRADLRIIKIRRMDFLVSVLFVFLFFGCKTQEASTPTKPGTSSREQFKTLFHEAMSEKMIGHYDKAIGLFKQCLTIEQNNAAVHFALSDLFELTGNLPAAIESARMAYGIDNTNKWYTLRLAQLYYKTGEFKLSADYFQLAITDEEQNLELKYQYAEALINSEQYAKAIVVLDDIETETGKFAEMSLAKHDMYMILGQPEKAKAEIDLLLTENPSNIEFRLTVARYYIDTDQYEKAILLGQEIVRINPQSGEGYFLLGDIEMRANNVQKAMDYFLTGFSMDDITIERKLYLINTLMPMAFNFSDPESKIIEQGLANALKLIYDPALKNPQLHIIYGDYLQKTGNKSGALEQFRIVCELNSSDFNFWSQLLKLELDLRDYANLFADAQKAIELFPSLPEFYLYAGIGARETGKFSESEEFLFLGKDLVINNNPLRAEFYIQLGILSCSQKKFGEGYAYFEESKSIDPTTGRNYGLKAKYLFLEGKISEAETEIKNGLAINPNANEILYAQGLVLISKKQYQEAVTVLAKAAGKDSDNYDLLELYGDALFLNGQTEDALAIWQDAQKKGNTSQLLKRKIADKTYYEN